VLDSKSEEDQALLAPLERPIDFLGEAARAHLDQVLAFLRDWGVPFEIDPGIVRGLDYYRRTAFEAHYQGIGAQSALGGGGRYDGLVENLGGPPMPGVGWAMGVERVLDAMAQEALAAAADEAPELFLVPLDDAAIAEVAALAVRLRRSRRVEHAYVRRNPGKGLRDADRSGATFAGLRGEAERRKDVLQLKHMASGEQTEVPVSDLEGFLDARA